MRRFHLFELHDMDWVPAACREALTDLMASFAVIFDIYRPLLPKLEALLQRLDERRIVDLGSGGTGPASTLVSHIRLEDGSGIRVVLTDLYPNLPAFRRARQEIGDAVEFMESPVDAMNIPAELTGFRTLFASFHHFRPDQAMRILHDAAVQGRGIAVFEFTERNFWLWGIPIVFIPAFFWFLTPFVRPLHWRRLFWTYAVPLVPLMGAWDAFVSCLRAYTLTELKEMTERIPVQGYEWEIGRVRTFGALHVTYLIGHPGGIVNSDRKTGGK